MPFGPGVHVAHAGLDSKSSSLRLLSAGYCWSVYKLRVLASGAAEPAVVGFWVTDGVKCLKHAK